MADTPSQNPELAPGPPAFSRKRLALPTLLSFVVAGALIALLVRRFELSPRQVWEAVRDARPGLYLLAFVVYYATFPLRGWRWRLLLNSAGAYGQPGQQRPSVFEHSQLILMNWLINSIAFFRLGDAYRAYSLNSRYRTSFSRTIGTILAERVMDVTTIFPLLLLAGLGLLHGETSGIAKAVVIAAASLALVTAAVILALTHFGPRLARRLPKRIQTLYVNFHEGAVTSLKKMPFLLALSTVIWLLEAARLYFVVHALGLNISLGLVLFAALAYSLLTTIPFTPGGLGFVEFGLTGILLLAFEAHDAGIVTLVDRSITYFSIIIFGGFVFLIRNTLDIRRKSRPLLPDSD